jgi:hypothetical protein
MALKPPHETDEDTREDSDLPQWSSGTVIAGYSQQASRRHYEYDAQGRDSTFDRRCRSDESVMKTTTKMKVV